MRMWALSMPSLPACLPHGAAQKPRLLTCFCTLISPAWVRSLPMCRAVLSIAHGSYIQLTRFNDTPIKAGAGRLPIDVQRLKKAGVSAGSLLETWVPLLHGGRIIISPPDEEAIGQLLLEAQVTAILMEGPEIYSLLEARLHLSKIRNWPGCITASWTCL